jgi:hypothetical protein
MRFLPAFRILPAFRTCRHEKAIVSFFLTAQKNFFPDFSGYNQLFFFVLLPPVEVIQPPVL